MQCQARVYHRDTYRYTGRPNGRHGRYELHYNQKRCVRQGSTKEGANPKRCWQHQNTVWFSDLQWLRFVEK